MEDYIVDGLPSLVDKLQNDVANYSNKIANQQFALLRELIIDRVEQSLGINDLNARMSGVPNKKGRPSTKKIIYVMKKKNDELTL